MKRFLFLLLTGIAALTIMCCSNPSGSSSDDTATTNPSTPTSTSTPASTTTPGTSASPNDPATSTTPETPASPTTSPTTSTTPVVKGTDASLSSLSLSVGMLAPAFSPDKLEYTANVDPSFPTITLTGTATDAKAALDANNDKAQKLVDGKNEIAYTVLAEDGATSRTYKITVTREKDTTPPVITACTISPTRIDTSLGDATLNGTIVIEDPSGISKMSDIRFLPYGVYATYQKDKSQSSFTHEVYNFTVTVPKGSGLGQWYLDLSDLDIYDTRDNLAHGDSLKVLPSGITKFDVYNGSSDQEGPKVTEFTVSQSTVSLKDSDATVSGTFKVEDPSGITYLDLDYKFGSVESLTKDTVLSSETVAVYHWTLKLQKGILYVTTANIFVKDGAGNTSYINEIESSKITSTID